MAFVFEVHEKLGKCSFRRRKKQLFVHSEHLIFKWKSEAFGVKVMDLLKALIKPFKNA